MKAEFKVTIEGKWFVGDKPVTKGLVIKDVRHALKEEFEFLAKKVSVQPIKEDFNNRLKSVLLSSRMISEEICYPGKNDFIEEIDALLKEMK